jgi:hypothetical protein
MQTQHSKDSSPLFSRREFVLCVVAIVLGLISFPLYQFFTLGGFIFYTNGIDESSYLSYPWSSYVVQVFGNHRISSRLVIALHRLGLSGGYCNLLFDAVCTLVILLGLLRLFSLIGFGRDDARRGAILVYTTPLLFCPSNPLVECVNVAHMADPYIWWTLVPFNWELPFARSPEPQLTWMLIVVWLNLFMKSRWLSISSLVLVPLLYSFVRLPFLFTVLACLFVPRVAIIYRITISWVVVGSLMALYLSSTANSSLEGFFVKTHLPMLSLMGVTSLGLYLCVRKSCPQVLRTLAPILVASAWVGPNIQVISGMLTAPVNYEQYWSVVISGFFLTLLILLRSSRPNTFVVCLLVLFGVQSARSWHRNYTTLHKLKQPSQVLALIGKAADRVAVSDVYLASYLDLAYPMQPATLFSYNRTFIHDSGMLYRTYMCARKHIEQTLPELQAQLTPVFARLDQGYRAKGVDFLVTAGRAELPSTILLAPPSESECLAEPTPYVAPTY